ncbi:hypothetical protein [Metallosphaera javensis (ex Hofmann et al. 2022)]|uniref:hypothetical protein n=1 Tax=Metallosphaera javensis (ex Hofmann et al. 2022) TaxID=99938 RepID=UPI001EDE58C4|nr:hypothetical protein [Metallosphaera javensis (ex Hofmann et al. 2022)]
MKLNLLRVWLSVSSLSALLDQNEIQPPPFPGYVHGHGENPLKPGPLSGTTNFLSVITLLTS